VCGNLRKIIGERTSKAPGIESNAGAPEILEF